MTTETVLYGAAVFFQASSFVIWTSLMGRLERWIFWSVWIGFLVMVLRRVVETTGWLNQHMFGHASAIVFSLIAFTASAQTRRLVQRREEARKKLILIQQQIAAIHAEAKESLALKLAEVLVQLKDQLNYYEAQAKDAGIPTFHESTGQGDNDITMNQSGGA